MSDVGRLVAAWSFLAAHRDEFATVDEFADLAEHGLLRQELHELWMLELDALADATRARARETELSLHAARVELAYSRIVRVCEDAMREHGLTVGEVAAAAAVVAAVLTASDGVGQAEGGRDA